MKKFKFLSLLVVISMLFVLPIVYAHDIEVDTDGIIDLSNFDGKVVNKDTKIIIAESYGQYTLSYQYIELNDTEWQAYLDAGEDAAAQEAALPAYNGSKWKTSSNNTAPLDTTGITEEKHFVLWVMVKSKDESKESILKDIPVIYRPQSASVDETKEESPSTGDETIFIVVGMVVVAMVAFVSYKKVNA